MHWFFCYIYQKQQIEVKYLFDRRIYSANQAIIIQRNLENFCLESANILNLLISVGILGDMVLRAVLAFSKIQIIRTSVAQKVGLYDACSTSHSFIALQHNYDTNY